MVSHTLKSHGKPKGRFLPQGWQPKKPLQDTTVSIVVTQGMSYRELARQAILAANNELCAGQLSGLNTALYGKKEDFPTEQQWVEDMIQRALNKWPKLLPTGKLTLCVPARMRLAPLGSKPMSPPRSIAPPKLRPLAQQPSVRPWTGGSDAEFAQWITQFTQTNFPPTTWKEKQRAHIAPEVVISTAKALNITGAGQQQRFAEALITQALQPDVGDPSWWNAVKAAYLKKHPKQDYDAALFSKKIMVNERRTLARKLTGAPENALLWNYPSNPKLYSANADRLSYTPDELMQVLENTVAASGGEVAFDGGAITITRTINGQTYQTALTVAQFKRWVEQETDNCPFIPGGAGEQGPIHIMANLIKDPVCGGLNPLIPEQGILMSFRYLAYLNALYGNNGYYANANVFAMYNGGPNLFTSTKITLERKQAAINYGNKIANGN
jgi:hypothetical protein